MNGADEFHRIQLELRFDGTAPTGRVCLSGGDPRGFSGWVGLISVVEELIHDEPSAARSVP